jgi:hypothetical protein
MPRLASILAAAALLGASGVGAYQLAAPSTGQGTSEWHEIAWSLPRDGWPAGRAFRCEGQCGGAELYVRAKLGFCNCDRGVADDDEVDRVTDLDLLSPKFSASAPGEELTVGELRGRARPYRFELPDGSHRGAVGIALSRRCDLLVAVVHGGAEIAHVQKAALAFLESREINGWMRSALDGR